MKKYLIVGGVAGGATAAARLRRLDETAEIIMFERGEYISFANCGLPYYVGEVIKERDRLLVQTPESFQQRFAVDVRTQSEVIGLEPSQKKVVVRSAGRGVYEESYDALLLAPGAKPIKPPIPGIAHERILTLRSVPDADALQKLASDYAGTGRAVVVGGGFIGVEAAENLRERGLSVTLVEAAPHILAPFDTDMVKYAEQELNEHGIGLVLQNGVARFEEAPDSSLQVVLADGQSLAADFVVLAIGVQPDTAFLQDTGIALDARGHILVNEFLQTNEPDIYAVGDAVLTRNAQTGEPAALALAGPANRQGRLAADHMTGLQHAYSGVQGTSVLKVFGLTAAATGRNERALQRAGLVRDEDYRIVKLHPFAHANYYPGAMQLSMKLIFAMDGKILGAQILGADGVDKRIDTIASAMRAGITAPELAELELAYAPPFSSAKDPVNMAGYIAQNIMEGLTEQIAYDALPEAMQKGARLIDVRTVPEYESGHLEGAQNIPLDDLRARLSELDPAVPLVVYCKVGLRGYLAERILKQHGYAVKNLQGGWSSVLVEDYQAKPADALAEKPADSVPQEAAEAEPQGEAAQIRLDLTGLSCPGPLMRLKRQADSMQDGQIVEATASDPGFFADSEAWCRSTGNVLISREKKNGQVIVRVQKSAAAAAAMTEAAPASVSRTALPEEKDHKTIVVFSGDLDKALASFVIANGAAAMGKKVTMFFTFWGLNILRREEKAAVKKGFIDRMFGWMMPRGSRELKLSQMNMLGMGTKLMRHVMQDKKIDSLETLIQSAQAAGIEMIACQMSMDVMGIHAEELVDGVRPGGVGAYLGAAEQANVNLFI